MLMHSIAAYMRDPELVTTVIRATGSIPNRLLVEPADAAGIIKQFKSEGAEAIARVATSPATLDKLSRDNRKGVRTALLSNPNITQDHIEEILARSLKKDLKEDDEVVAHAAKRLETSRLLKYLAGEVQIKHPSYRSNSGPQRTPGRFERILRHHVKTGGEEFIKEYNSLNIDTSYLGIDVYFRQSTGKMDWWEPGMLTWLGPLVPATHAGAFLASLLDEGYELTVEDVEAITPMAAQYPGDLPRHCRNSIASDEVIAAVRKISRPFDQFADILVKYRRQMPQGMAAHLRRAEPVQAAPMGTWTSTVVNKLADGMFREGFTGLAVGNNYRVSYASPTASQDLAAAYANASIAQASHLLTSKSYAKLNHRALAYVLICNPDEDLAHQAFRAWLDGELRSQPTVKAVREVFAIAGTDMRTMVAEEFIEHGHMDLIPREALTELEATQVLRSPRLTAAVFTQYLGTGTDTWQTAIDLASEGWDGTLSELIETSCAATDEEMPEYQDPTDEPEADALPTLF